MEKGYFSTSLAAYPTVLVCSGRLAILAESPKPQGKNHEGKARHIPTGLPLATAQDNPYDLKPAG